MAAHVHLHPSIRSWTWPFAQPEAFKRIRLLLFFFGEEKKKSRERKGTAKILALLALVIALTTLGASAQTLIVRGTIADDTGSAGIGIQHAAVVLIRAGDSTLVTFGRSKSDGSFSLTADSPGRYILLATHLGSADFVETFSLSTDTPTREVGIVPMLARERLIQEVLVRGRSAITLRGDTVEYTADSFAVREGATVEELLRKLPGLQVDRNGKITAQGEAVQKVLVDGEEFFSDDPAVVTQNLQAKAVDAVQIFDKKSDQAELTGIDDGERQKTINLKLKDAYKRGYFGKAQAAAGPSGMGTDGMRNGYFENQFMANAFRNKRQVSVFGIAANTGRTGLGWEDRGKYAGSGGGAVADEETGDMYTTGPGWGGGGGEDGTDWQGNFNGEGLPKVWTGGAHYADKWGPADAQHLSGNYRASKLISENIAGTTTQHILPDSTYTRTQDRRAFSDARRHRADGLYEWKLDTAKSIRLTADAGWSETASDTRSLTRTFAEEGTEVNRSNRTLFSNALSKTQNASLSWRQKMAKKGRSLSINLRESLRESATDSRLDVVNTFFSAGSTGSVDTVAQQKDYDTRNLTLKGGASYTEPLSKTFFAEARYDLDLTDARSTRLSYDRAPGGESYDLLARDFSSDYDYHAATHTGGVGLRFVNKKVTASAGSGVGFTRFDQEDLLFGTSIRRTYSNYYPRASLVWRIGRQTTLRVNYNGRTEQPSIEQIQPLRENTDPLNVMLGNPALRQQFHHGISANFNDYKVLTGAYKYAGLWGNITQDKITQASITDEAGRRTTQWVNVDGGYNTWFWGGYGRKIKSLDLMAHINANAGLAKTIAFINGTRGTTTNNSYSVDVSFDRSWKKGSSDTDRAGINVHPDFTYFDNRSSLSSLVTNYYQLEITGEAWVELPARFRISSSAWVNLRQRTDVFPTNNNVVRWDAYVARKFLKDNALEARIAVFDILNQNIGFNRTASPTNITENRYLTVRRYGLLMLVWNFTKSSGGAPQNDAMMIGG